MELYVVRVEAIVLLTDYIDFLYDTYLSYYS